MRVGIGLVGFGLSCYPSSHIFSMPIQIGFFRSKWSMKTDICRLRGPNMIAFCLVCFSVQTFLLSNGIVRKEIRK